MRMSTLGQHAPALMRGRRWAVRLIVAAGVLSAVNGAAHFVLPVWFPWEQHVVGLYAPLRWALFATTVFFGVLLLLAGVLTVVVARASDVPRRLVVWVVAGMAGFWLLAAGYELIVPFPAPGADSALPAFSVVVALLHLSGLWLWLRAPAAVDSSSHDLGGSEPIR